MRVLVTGGTGFIGSHVVDKLKQRGFEVRIFDMMLPSRKDVEFYQGSLLNYDDVGMAMSGIDIVIHLAAIADVKQVFEEPMYSESINVRGTINVLEACRTHKVKRLVYTSTTWVYSAAVESAVDEKTPLLYPDHLYTATKIASEYYCQTYSKLYNLPITIVRYGIPYGPRARDGAVIPIFVRKAMNGEALTIAGDGLQFRKFVYVEDLAEGTIAAMKSVAKNKIYNLDGKEKISIRQIAETIQKILGNVKIEYIPNRPGDFTGKDVSSELAKQDLGWESSTPFETGVRKYIDWYKQNKHKQELNWETVDQMLETKEKVLLS